MHDMTNFERHRGAERDEVAVRGYADLDRVVQRAAPEDADDFYFYCQRALKPDAYLRNPYYRRLAKDEPAPLTEADVRRLLDCYAD